MLLNEIHQPGSPPAEDAFWAPARGPNDTPGFELRYIQDADAWHDHLRGQAAEKGDERWAGNIERMASQYQPGHLFTPMLAWFTSPEDYEAGKSGFGGVTKEKIQQKHPNLVIHDSREEAIHHHKSRNA